ncbi:hypothetical protein [Parapedobacter sp. 2B3]|uniref:immunoglobulin domain-containing protein n=1 Tax=Parapedobacter sp. 2B3 TaxID=3342381 RepID=UPI0035B583ED
MLLLGAVKVGYGQRVYADSYGASESGDGLVVLGIPVLSPGHVKTPNNVIQPNSLNGNYSELTVGGLAGDAYARLQLKFINGTGNLPAGTSVYIRIDGSTNNGLLGLLLASAGFVTAQQNAEPGNLFEIGNSTSITGQSVAIGNRQDDIIDGSLYLKITPSECFNAVTISINTAGLIGLLSSAKLQVYHAFYECPPSISVVENPTICTSETATLQVENPISASDCDYLWYNSATGGTSIGSGSSFTTDELMSTTTFYVGYSGVDPEECGRTPVVVTVVPQPGKPHLTITDVHN